MTNFYRFLHLMTLANRQGPQNQSLLSKLPLRGTGPYGFSCSVISSLSARAIELEYAIYLRPGSIVYLWRDTQTFPKV